MNPRDLTLGRRPPDGAFISHREHGFLIVLPVQAGRMLLPGTGLNCIFFRILARPLNEPIPEAPWILSGIGLLKRLPRLRQRVVSSRSTIWLVTQSLRSGQGGISRSIQSILADAPVERRATNAQFLGRAAQIAA